MRRVVLFVLLFCQINFACCDGVAIETLGKTDSKIDSNHELLKSTARGRRRRRRRRGLKRLGRMFEKALKKIIQKEIINLLQQAPKLIDKFDIKMKNVNESSLGIKEQDEYVKLLQIFIDDFDFDDLKEFAAAGLSHEDNRNMILEAYPSEEKLEKCLNEVFIFESEEIDDISSLGLGDIFEFANKLQNFITVKLNSVVDEDLYYINQLMGFTLDEDKNNFILEVHSSEEKLEEFFDEAFTVLCSVLPSDEVEKIIDEDELQEEMEVVLEENTA